MTARDAVAKYRTLRKKQSVITEKIEELENLLIGVGSPVIDDMPKGSGAVNYQKEKVLDKIEELKQELSEVIQEEENLRVSILAAAITILQDKGERKLFQLYLDGASVKELSEIFSYSVRNVYYIMNVCYSKISEVEKNF